MEIIESKRWKNMFSAFFVDYNNGFQKDYQMFSIEKQKEDFNWRDFINKIRTFSSGCQSKDFQKALQENNIYFIADFKIDQKSFDEYMDFDFNKTHCTVLEHNNIGNY